jgi:hypothetical protein
MSLTKIIVAVTVVQKLVLEGRLGITHDDTCWCDRV